MMTRRQAKGKCVRTHKDAPDFLSECSTPAPVGFNAKLAKAAKDSGWVSRRDYKKQSYRGFRKAFWAQNKAKAAERKKLKTESLVLTEKKARLNQLKAIWEKLNAADGEKKGGKEPTTVKKKQTLG